MSISSSNIILENIYQWTAGDALTMYIMFFISLSWRIIYRNLLGRLLLNNIVPISFHSFPLGSLDLVQPSQIINYLISKLSYDHRSHKECNFSISQTVQRCHERLPCLCMQLIGLQKMVVRRSNYLIRHVIQRITLFCGIFSNSRIAFFMGQREVNIIHIEEGKKRKKY